MELHRLSLAEARHGLHRKEFSSCELTTACLARISSVDSKVKAYISVLSEEALRQADQADRLIADGHEQALTGVPLAVKDNMMVKGTVTTAGSKILEKYRATYDATVIRILRAQGAVMLGKTNLDEFAMGSSTENSGFFPTHNPWDLNRVPGGSSGGSAAAVAGDMCIAALGSDTASSVRQPASLCGVVGMLPTYGRVSRNGLIAMTSSLDQIGPVAKTVEDAAVILNAISGHDDLDATSSVQPAVAITGIKNDIKGLKVGVPKEFFVDEMDPAVATTVRAAVDVLQDLGAQLVEVSLPLIRHSLAVYQLTATAEISSNLARFDGIRYGHSVDANTLAEVYSRSRAEGLGSEVKRRIILGTYLLSAGYQSQYYQQAQKVRTMIRQQFADVFKEVDCLVGPTSPCVAFPIGERFNDPLTMYLADMFTVPVNIGGICGISVPCGMVNELPVGLQIMAKQFDDETALRVAYQYEQATTWHTLQPKLD